ncbi:hypothetical protein E4U42_008050 [Claviceps africana]|uniref:Uncharacterized protein n=1 Tax=Claviceps africana TaxID=83212 RepID=A0A8K0J0Q1_9HYPO|nr:hypothetical protein E4U42_008050 [Claviceps africana]
MSLAVQSGPGRVDDVVERKNNKVEQGAPDPVISLEPSVMGSWDLEATANRDAGRAVFGEKG